MHAPATWTVRGRTLLLSRPLIMGILNVTTDSFSDGGQFVGVDSALVRARQLADEGADVIDVGGESTRPHGAREVSVADEMALVIPVVSALAAALPDVPISVDTVKSAVAAEALAAGAAIVNDVSAMRLDRGMAGVCARAGCGVVLMHSRGAVTDMASYAHADYDGPVLDVMERELSRQVDVALHAGVAPSCIALDPGIGFAKRAEHSLAVLAGLEQLVALGYPVLVGASRKRFIGTITGVSNPADRVAGSVGAAVAAFERGASVLRVHDVAATRHALDVVAAIRRAATPVVPA